MDKSPFIAMDTASFLSLVCSSPSINHKRLIWPAVFKAAFFPFISFNSQERSLL